MQTHISVAHCSSKLWLVDMVRNEQFFLLMTWYLTHQKTKKQDKTKKLCQTNK